MFVSLLFVALVHGAQHETGGPVSIAGEFVGVLVTLQGRGMCCNQCVPVWPSHGVSVGYLVLVSDGHIEL